MTPPAMTPRALLSLLFNGTKAIDVAQTALDLGLLDALEGEPVSLCVLADELHVAPTRLYKFLDCLESIGFVRREQKTSQVFDTTYHAVEGVRQAAVDVLGADSIERDRDHYPWATLQGRLPAVLRGEIDLPPEAFSWPPVGDAQIATFERSMAAGLGPITESFRTHSTRLWNEGARLLDVGGGDGSLAVRLLADNPTMRIDVYNLPEVRPLVERTREQHGARLGFVGGDFLAERLPGGYDTLTFVRVLHDWPSTTAYDLLAKAYAALEAGGKVLICEEFRNADRLAAQFFWSYFLLGVDNCSSMLREVDQYARILTEVGFHDVEVLPGPFELIVAVKR